MNQIYTAESLRTENVFGCFLKIRQTAIFIYRAYRGWIYCILHTL